MNKPRLIDRIEQFRSLENDWDGLGAEGINGGAVDCAIRFVNALPESVDDSKLFVYPSVCGGVVFEFENEPNHERIGQVEMTSLNNADVWTYWDVEKSVSSFISCTCDRKIMEHFLNAYRWVFRQAETCV